MKFTDLEPRFLKIVMVVDTWTRVLPGGGTEQVTGPRQHHHDVDALSEAQGVFFLCPKCFVTNNGSIGTHGVICWFAGCGVPDSVEPGPARWPATGTGLADLTLTPSVLLVGGCAWHGFVTAGNVTSC